MPISANYYYYQNEKLPIVPYPNKVAIFFKTSGFANSANAAFTSQLPANQWSFSKKEGLITTNLSYEEARSVLNKIVPPDSVFVFPICRYKDKRLSGYNDLMFNGYLIARFNDKLPKSHITEICKKQNCRPVKQLGDKSPSYLVQYMGEEQGFMDAVNGFRERFDKETVLYAHPDFINAVRMEATAPAPPAMQQFVFQQIGLVDAWQKLADNGLEIGNVKVAVLDEGIQNPHQDLKQVSRFDQVGGNCPFNSNNHHGTAVAGVIGALNNKNMMIGVAYDTNLADIRISYLDQNKNRQSSTSKVVNGLKAAIRWGAKVINISWTHPLADEVTLNIGEALKQGIVVCCAAGNYVRNESQTVRFPALLAKDLPVIAVAACDQTNNLVNWSTQTGFGSCRGNEVTLAAPSLNITALTIGSPHFINNFSGTSAATALVSGAAALLLALDPTRTPQQIRDLLRDNASVLGKVLNAKAALDDIL